MSSALPPCPTEWGPVALAAYGAVAACSNFKVSASQAARLVAAAARGATQGMQAEPGSASGHGEGPIWSLQDLLGAAGGELGKDSLNVSELKDTLRKKGEHALAGRLGKASKLRNGAAHPDIQLKDDIIACLKPPLAEQKEGYYQTPVAADCVDARKQKLPQQKEGVQRQEPETLHLLYYIPVKLQTFHTIKMLRLH